MIKPFSSRKSVRAEEPTSQPPETTSSLIGLRVAVVTLCALFVGISSGVLTFMVTRSLPQAVLFSGGSFGGAILFFDRLIDR